MGLLYYALQRTHEEKFVISVNKIKTSVDILLSQTKLRSIQIKLGFPDQILR